MVSASSIPKLIAALDVNAGSEDAASDAAKDLATLCDRFIKTNTPEEVIANRQAIGQVNTVWSLLVDLMKRKATRLQAVTTLSLVAFDNLHNSVSVVKAKGLMKTLTTMLREGSDEEKEWAAGAIANICVNDSDDSARLAFASCAPLLLQLRLACTHKSHLVKLRAIGAVNNLSRSSSTKEALVEADFFTLALRPVIDSKGSGDKHAALVARATMAAANLVGRDENSGLSASSMGLATIVKCFEFSLEAQEQKLFGVVWTVPLTLFPLFNLSVADENKKSLLDAGLMGALLKLVKTYRTNDKVRASIFAKRASRRLSDGPNAKATTAALQASSAAASAKLDSMLSMIELGLHTVMNMSFDDSVKKWLKKEANMKVLMDLHSVDPPRSFRAKLSAKDIINNILWELDQDNKAKKRLAEPQQINKGKWVMISYNWGSQALVKKVADRLVEAGVNVWMDILPGCMEGHTLEAMADAVGNASAVLMFVTRAYKESANCRREGSYAQDLRKPIIPIILEPGYSMDGTWGWLGLVLAGKLFIDMAHEKQFDVKTSELIGEIATQTEGGAAIRSDDSGPTKIEPLPKDIASWLTECGLEKHLLIFAKHELRSKPVIAGLTGRDLEMMGLPVGSRILLSRTVVNKMKPHSKAMETNPKAVGKWLDGMGLSKYAAVFDSQELNNLELVASVNDSDLERMISAIGHRVTLRQATSKLPGHTARRASVANTRRGNASKFRFSKK